MAILQKELKKWNDKLIIYRSSIDILSSQVRLVVDSFSAMKENDGSTSIQKVTKRIKTINSIQNKLKKKGLNFTLEEIDKNIHDIIGIRIVCLTMTDVKEIVESLCELLNATPNIKIRETKDYINNPKKSGYRAYHLQLCFDVMYGGEKYTLNAEIQVKTAIMDAWAELEHRLRYKYSSLDNLPDELKCDFDMLKEQFDLLAHSGEVTDNRIGRFINEVEKLKCPKKIKVQNIDIPKSLINEWEEREPVYKKAEDVINSSLRFIYENNKEIMNEDGYSWVQKYTHRIKPMKSIIQKLNKKELELNIDNIESSVHDLIGYRIVCLTQNDLYESMNLILDSFSKNQNVTIKKIKDYIDNPKQSGYRGINIQLEYNINYGGYVYKIPAEIQFRTAAMDSWAELEQKFKYKEEYSSKIELTPELKQLLNRIKDQLYTLALTSASLDDMASDFINKSKEMKKIKVKKSS